MTTLRTIFCTLVVLIATINVSARAAGTDEALAKYVPTDAVLVLEVRDPDRLERTFNQMAKGMGKESFDRTLSGEASHGIFGGEKNPADPDKGMMIAVSFRQKENAGWGGMPESEVTMIFHAAKDHTKAPEPRDKDYKTIRIIDGVVIATHATDWSAPTERCPLVAMLMPGEISGALAFDTIWKQFGPMAEMSIGMMVAMSGQKQDKPPSSTALAPLWAALQDVGTIQVGLSFGSDAVSLNSRINTLSPVTDRPDGPAIRAMATHLDNTPIMFALDKQLTNWFHTVMTDFLQIATMFAAQESNAPAGLDKVSDQIHLIMEATLKADRAGIVSTYDIFNQRSVTIQGTNDPAKTIALHRNMLKELAKVPEFMTLSPVQGTPNAWTIKDRSAGREVPGIGSSPRDGHAAGQD